MKMTDFPCLYRFADAEKSIQCDFFCGLSSIFGLSNEEILEHSDLFAHTSQGVLFNGAGLTADELDSFGKKRLDRPFPDCKALSSAFSDYDLKNEACQICHLSFNYKNTLIKDEQMLLSFILQKGRHYEELLDDLQEKNFCSVCYLVPGKSLRTYPLVQFNRHLLTYLKSLDSFETMTKDDIASAFAPYLHDAVRSEQKKKRIKDATIPAPVNISFHDIVECINREFSVIYNIRMEVLNDAQITKCRARNRCAARYSYNPPTVKHGTTSDPSGTDDVLNSLDNKARRKSSRYKGSAASIPDFQISVFDLTSPSTDSVPTRIHIVPDIEQPLEKKRTKKSYKCVKANQEFTDNIGTITDDPTTSKEPSVLSAYAENTSTTEKYISGVPADSKDNLSDVCNNSSSDDQLVLDKSVLGEGCHDVTMEEPPKLSADISESEYNNSRLSDSEEPSSKEYVLCSEASEEPALDNSIPTEEAGSGASVAENAYTESINESGMTNGSFEQYNNDISSETPVIAFGEEQELVPATRLMCEMSHESDMNNFADDTSVTFCYDDTETAEQTTDDYSDALPAIDDAVLFELITEPEIENDIVIPVEENTSCTYADTSENNVAAQNSLGQESVTEQSCLNAGPCRECTSSRIKCRCCNSNTTETTTESNTANSTVSTTDTTTENTIETYIMTDYKSAVAQFRSPEYETCFIRSSCGLLYPLYNLSDSFFTNIVDCSIDDIRNIHHFLTDSCSSTTICIEAVRYHMRSGLLFYMECSGRFYFFDIEFSYSNFLQPILGTASKIKYLSLNSIPVYHMLSVLGFKHVYIDMLPNLFSCAHELVCNIPFSELFELVLRAVKEDSTDFYQFAMPFYRALYNTLDEQVKKMDMSTAILMKYRGMNGFNRALASAYDLSDIVLDLKLGVEGINQHDYLLRYGKDMQIVSRGILYVVQFAFLDDQTEDIIYTMFHNIISSVYLLPYNCILPARLLSISPSAIAFFCTSDGDEFFDILLDQARKVYQDMFQKIPVLETQRIVF